MVFINPDCTCHFVCHSGISLLRNIRNPVSNFRKPHSTFYRYNQNDIMLYTSFGTSTNSASILNFFATRFPKFPIPSFSVL